uniref:MEG 2.3 isoform 5 n=1 Tax=Schistosoma mansoni TaxID=6183 RepID=D7PD70_SCHMA|nr:MEG 2.3 isoform 5 [Schistosoma mansoni]
MCLTIFYVIHLLAIFSDGAEWVITCNFEDGYSLICCVGNDCKDVIKPRSSGADDLNLFLSKRGMANKLGEILKNLN